MFACLRLVLCLVSLVYSCFGVCLLFSSPSVLLVFVVCVVWFGLR